MTYNFDGGMQIAGGSPIVRNCRFSGNRSGCSSCKQEEATGGLASSWNGGAGLSCGGNSNALIINCTFENNWTDGRVGGGLFCNNSSPEVIDCLFSHNDGYYAGGAVYCSGGSRAHFVRCIFRSNTASLGPGGGIFCSSSSPVFDSCLINGNTDRTGYYYWPFYNGSALYCEGNSVPELNNCTIVSNACVGECTIAPWRRGAIHCSDSSGVIIRNSIIAYNASNAVLCPGDTGNVTIICTNIYGNTYGDWTSCIADQNGQNGNISSDPRFCDSNYRLYAASPCLPVNNSCGVLMGAYGMGENCRNCCLNTRGNADGDPEDKVNISDITYLVGYLFSTPSGPAPPCLEEGNADGDSQERINILDITYLVSYLFGSPSGPAPPACP
jgi:hypothetical protein